MHFGIFSVGDVTADPTTGRAPTESQRIRATVTIAKKAEEVGLDVFATGEHHNPPFVPSSPTITHIFVAGNDYLDREAVLAVKDSLIKDFARQAPRTPTPDGREVGDQAWSRVLFDVVLAPAGT